MTFGRYPQPLVKGLEATGRGVEAGGGCGR